MFIQTEETPNPESLKFLPGAKVSDRGPTNFKSLEDCSSSTLAAQIMQAKYVKSVFFGEDFITVTKQKDKNWEVIKPVILLMIMEHFSANLTVFDDVTKKKSKLKSKSSGESVDSSEEDSEIVSQIKEIIETRVRPAVANDGGDIIFHSFADGILKLELHGACSGCPSSSVTLKNGIENMMKYYVPEVESVEAINSEEE